MSPTPQPDTGGQLTTNSEVPLSSAGAFFIGRQPHETDNAAVYTDKLVRRLR